jgi:hypothetical protein
MLVDQSIIRNEDCHIVKVRCDNCNIEADYRDKSNDEEETIKTKEAND